MAGPTQIVINSKQYDLAAQTLLPSGIRAYTRHVRPVQDDDPTRPLTRTWNISGPMGYSREGADGYLGTDWAELDHQYDDLLTAPPLANTITLTTGDPIDTTSSALGFMLGTAMLGGGTSNYVPRRVSHIHADRDQLFFSRGAFVTQVDPSDWSFVETKTLDGIVQGMEVWRGKGRVAVGAADALQTRTGVTATGSTYADTQVSGTDVNAKALRADVGRLWLVDASATNNNRVRYTLDDFDSISNAFVVGDPSRDTNGIGIYGQVAIFGKTDGIVGFTDIGHPLSLNDALRGAISTANGAQFATIWGWTYAITQLGIYAWQPMVANPVGIEASKGFEGDIDGRPTAIFAWREGLFAAYRTTAGDGYLVKGEFGPETKASGLPHWYFFAKLSGAQCDAISGWASSDDTINPNILAGYTGTNAVRFIMGRRGRDIADANYRFSTSGGAWYGTATAGTHLHLMLRHAEFIVENATATATMQLAVAVDGGSYVNVGSAVTSSGHKTVRPVSAGAPLSTVAGHSFKPRLTQVNDSQTAPVQVRGHLSLTFDVRPLTVLEIRVVLKLTTTAERTTLEALLDHDTATAVAVVLPGETTTRYGHVIGVSMRDLAGDSVLGAEVTILLWETS